jgi:hypothetical protein
MLATPRSRRLAVVVLICAATLSCTFTGTKHREAYRFFVAPSAGDPWSGKIRGWQARERAHGDTELLANAPASVSGAGEDAVANPGEEDLRAKYFAFRRAQKREMAEGIARWIQQEARGHYQPDLVFHFLRDLGFRDDEVFRAIVMRPSDGQHHMVTLWFDTPDDPFVIDPTGAMTSGMPRLSEVPGWVPLKLFTDEAEFTARALASNQP